MTLLITLGLGGNTSSLLTLGLLDMMQGEPEYYTGVYAPYLMIPHEKRFTEHIVVFASIIKTLLINLSVSVTVIRIFGRIGEQLHTVMLPIVKIREHLIIDTFTAPQNVNWGNAPSRELEEAIEGYEETAQRTSEPRRRDNNEDRREPAD